MTTDLSDYPNHGLLKLYAGVLRELRSRGVIRSSNNPVADYAEGLAARALGFELMTKSKTGFDGMDRKGLRYEVKSRRLTPENSSTQTSAIRGLQEDHFDFLVGIRFLEDFSVDRACLVPIRIVREQATFREHVNAWILHLRDSLWDIEDVEDLTEGVRQTAEGR